MRDGAKRAESEDGHDTSVATDRTALLVLTDRHLKRAGQLALYVTPNVGCQVGERRRQRVEVQDRRELHHDDGAGDVDGR